MTEEMLTIFIKALKDKVAASRAELNAATTPLDNAAALGRMFALEDVLDALMETR